MSFATGSQIGAGGELNASEEALVAVLNALSVTDGNFIVGNDSTWITESGATARTSLGLTLGTDVLAYDAGVQQIADLADPNADRLLFWDDSESAYAYLTAGSGITISGATISSSTSGTVTSVSVVTANGVSGTVATATTTPAITLTLGAITPTSVTGMTDITVADGGTGRSTSTTAYGLIAAGTTATGAHQTLAAGLTTEILVGGGASALPAWGTDIPTAVTIGAAYIHRVGGTDVALADGGTNASLTANNGGIFYSTATAGAILAGTATAGQILRSGASTTPAWSTPTFPNAATAGTVIRGDGTNLVLSTLTIPDTAAVSTILYASATNVISALATANSGVLVTGGTGIPSIATDIPTAVTIGTAYIYRVGGTDVSVADGGTGVSTLGDAGVLIGNGTGAVQVTGAGTSGQVLTSNGAGVDPTFQAAASSASTVATVSTTFEVIGRFVTAVGGSGAATVGTDGGILVSPGATSGSFSNVNWYLGGGQGKFFMYAGSPLASFMVGVVSTTASAGTAYIGMGLPGVDGTGHTFTANHIGFKIVSVASAASYYATQADGTTETASAALGTTGPNQNLDLILKVNTDASVDYYHRKNGATTLSSATNLTTNMPTVATNTDRYIQFSASNNSEANNYQINGYGASYTR